MRKITLFLFLFIGIMVNAQSAKEMLKEIEGKWELDDNNNVTFVKIIDAPNLSKDEIFNRTLDYFTYNYGSGKSVIQSQDKEMGRIVGKGLYDDVHVGVSIVATYVDAWHILRVDVKDGKARAIITLNQYDKKIVGSSSSAPSYSSEQISMTYPINPKGGQKTVMTKAFYKTYKKALATLDSLEKAIIEGNTSQNIENSDW